MPLRPSKLCLRLRAGLAGALASCALALPARADPEPLRTTYGDTGILEMPSARMAPDGEFGLTAGVLNNNQRYSFWFQIVPWLEGSFRYSRVGHLSTSGSEYDRSLGLKIRLSQEDEDWPAIALGIRDLLGTGLYGSEYVVASKRFDDFDVSAGVGWGRLASSGALPNPFAQIFPSFKVRNENNFGKGGTVSFSTFFHGPNMGVFGGATWHTPIPDLDVLAEYSSDRYLREKENHAFGERLPFNIGLAYRPISNVALTAGWFYGTSYGLTLSISANPNIPGTHDRFSAHLPEPLIRSDRQQADAIAALIKPDPAAAARASAPPWVQVPEPKPDPNRALVASLMAIGSGVRDVEVDGSLLVVNAQQKDARSQCGVYARIVSTVNANIHTVAVSDLRDGDGTTYFCKVDRSALDASDLRLADDTTPSPDVPAGDEPSTAPLSSLPPAAIEEKIRGDLDAQSIRVEALGVQRSHLWLYYTNYHYLSEAEAVGRVARVLMNDAPPSVEIFHIIAVTRGLAQSEVRIARSALERAEQTYASGYELGRALTVKSASLDNPILDKAQDESYPRFHWSVSPGLREALFDPALPVQVQILAVLSGSVEVTPKLSVDASVEGNVYDNYNLALNPDSQLPHVRSDILEYYRHGINGIANLDAVYRERLSPDLTAELKVGYLESMYAGIGGQILWRPAGERFAIGADLYQVWKRDFDRLFGVQDYHVMTGHVTLYYQSPWYGLNFNVHAGRFLAGDYGATIEVVRRFSTGVEIGAFATFTNVPFSKFGEGSFDKGIIIRIPLEWALPFFSKSSYNLTLRSLTRDGGQRLEDDDSLYFDTQPASVNEIEGHLDEITSP
jgi:Exopolysaccharide biosynthesis protein YbjH